MAAGFFQTINDCLVFENHRQKCRFCFKVMTDEEISAHIENAAKLFADLTQWKLQISDKYSSKKVCTECFDSLIKMARIKNQTLKNQLKYEECLLEEEMLDSAGIAELVQIPLNIELELNSDSIDEKQSNIQITNVEYLDLDTRETNSVMDLTASSSEVYEMSELQKKTAMIPDLETTLLKPFKCNDCPYSSNRLSHLQNHSEIHLPRSERTKFVCNYCGAVFLSKYYYKLHTLKHSGGFMYECRLCDVSFKLGNQLQLHMRMIHDKDEY